MQMHGRCVLDACMRDVRVLGACTHDVSVGPARRMRCGSRGVGTDADCACVGRMHGARTGARNAYLMIGSS
jgi:hypothetical protein